ncbi:MAG TPA: collagenase-like protease [Firmicutes bacterium]|nr:collagenase-like protease [Bacillota bacterium]
MNKIELLAPSGDYERLKIACLYGADAIYFGGQNYSLRANAHNFSLEDIASAVSFAHNLNKKVYVTVNIVFHDKDLTGLEEYLKELDHIGVDAIIVSDVVVMDLWKKLNLKLELHISTQASSLNYETVKFYQSLGATRVVLAREATKEDIKRIKEETGIELECFVHGAMCTSISGRCVLSNYATNRDSNRGGCAQVCRFTFDSDKSDQIFSMTPKDLNMINNIEEMIKIGVNSFKVEGRMRSVYYIATVIYTYRHLIDKIVNNTLDDAYTKYSLSILNRCANRDSTEQFFNTLPGKEEQYFLSNRDEISNKDFLGIVDDYNEETNIVTLEQRNYFTPGETVEFFGPNLEATTFTIPENITDEDDNLIEVANHPKMIVKFKCNIKLTKYDMMRKKVFDISQFL